MEAGTAIINDSFARMKSVSRFISVLFTAALVLLVIGALVFIALLIVSVLFPDSRQDPLSFSGPEIILLAFFLIVAGSVLWVIRKIFNDIAKGISPFSHNNAKRIRWVAWLLLIDVLLEIVVSPGFGAIVHVSSLDVGYIASSATKYPVLPINSGSLVGSVISFCLSVVFEYGYLLQRLSDETV